MDDQSSAPAQPVGVEVTAGTDLWMKAEEQEIAAAFSEWDRRWREEPERFESEAVHLLKGNPVTYGEACAPYFLNILHGLLNIGTEEVDKDDFPTSAPEPSRPAEVPSE